MLFAGLVGGYLVLRYASPAWPSPGMPLLPVRWPGSTRSSSLCRAWPCTGLSGRCARSTRADSDAGWSSAAALGVLFLGLQAAQWTLLVRGGLSFTGTTYGTTFYMLTGVHAAHALSGVVWLLVIALRQRELWVPDSRQRTIEVCALYWHFVGLIWFGLYVLLYLI